MQEDNELPICRLLSSRMSTLGLTERQLVKICGYRSIPGGLRALRQTLVTGKVHPFLAQSLPGALAITQETFDRAIAESEWILAARTAEAKDNAERQYRDGFRPYIWARFKYGSPKPNTISVLGGIYSATYLPHDCLSSSALEEKDFRNLIRKHFDRWGPTMPIYGLVIGYYAVVGPASEIGADLAIPLDSSGRVVGGMRSIERPQFLLTRQSSDRLLGWISDLDRISRSRF